MTGCAGFIGSHIVDRLIDDGHVVTGVDDLSAGSIKNVQRLCPLRIGGFLKRDFSSESVLSMVRSNKFDVIFHEAAIPRVSFSVEHPSLTNDANIGKTVKLLEALRGTTTRLVFASSSSVYGGATILPTPNDYPKNPRSPYALQKSVCEDYCKMFASLYGVDSVCLRYFNVFGQRQDGNHPYATVIAAWASAASNKIPLRCDGDGEQTRDHCHVKNVVDANILAATSTRKFAGECYNVACGSHASNNEILLIIQKRFNFWETLRVPDRIGDVRHSLADISKTKTDLGYTPRQTFSAALTQHIEEVYNANIPLI